MSIEAEVVRKRTDLEHSTYVAELSNPGRAKPARCGCETYFPQVSLIAAFSYMDIRPKCAKVNRKLASKALQKILSGKLGTSDQSQG